MRTKKVWLVTGTPKGLGLFLVKKRHRRLGLSALLRCLFQLN
jgi:hypothetical protein